jgi:YggT family protein
MAAAMQWLRWTVLSAAALLAAAGFAAMAVQRRTINPFSRTARVIRRATDPFLRPLERRLIRSGHSPQAAPTWLIGTALVGGIVVMTVAGWVMQQLAVVTIAGAYGEQTRATVIAYTLLRWAFTIVEIALIVRVIGSWIGMDRFHRFMRPFVWLTEWMLAPLRRVIPPFGGFVDVTPIVAWLLLRMLLRPLAFYLLSLVL